MPFSNADRMIVPDSMRSGIWQLAVLGGEADGEANEISCQSVAEPMKSLCRGENASVILTTVLSPLCRFILHSLSSSFTLFCRCFVVERDGGNNQRKFDGSTRLYLSNTFRRHGIES